LFRSRDVKPSNILIRHDGRALLFDFGLARTDDDQSLTVSGEFMGTPSYVAPEQAAGRTDQIDARADVYSLGVTLFELLTLQLPFRAPSSQELLRRIQTQQPQAPRRLNSQVPRDLETVCLAAIERDLSRRYGSTAELAADLRRFLEFRPVHARAATTWVRVTRFVRRHRAATTVVALSLLLFFGAPTALWLQQRRANAEVQKALTESRAQEREARRQERLATEARDAAEDSERRAVDERDRAEREREKATRINDFLDRMLSSVRPGEDGSKVRVAQILDRSAEEIEGAFPDMPLVEAALRQTIGSSYASLGIYASAREQLERARELQEGHASTDGDIVTTLEVLTFVLAQVGQWELAEQAGEQSIERARLAFGDLDERTLQQRSNYAQLLAHEGRFEKALEQFPELEALCRRSLGDEHPITLTILHNQALALMSAGELEAGVQMIEQALELRERTLGPEDPETLFSMANYAQGLKELGRLDEAEPLLMESIRLNEKVFGETHPYSFAARHNWIGILVARGDNARALGLEQELYQEQLEFHGGQETADSLRSLNTIAAVTFLEGDAEEAARKIRKAYDARLEILGPDHPDTLESAINLTFLEAQCGRFPEAEAAAEGYLALLDALEDPPRPALVEILQLLQQLYQQRGSAEKAAEVQQRLESLR
ncbi:MAG: serine/threonine-protein kinase, partial [Planctomycetota bacterium]